jgi:uncharacterized membrane protein YebE (DUF533 family)
MDFMSLLGSMIQGTTASSSTTSQRVSNAGGGIQDLLGSLMGAGQSVTQKVGGDNLAAGGIGALLGALMGGSRSTTLNSLGGGMMGLLGMMAYKALKGSMGGSSTSSSTTTPQAYTPATPQQQAKDAEIILLAMIDAAKADGQVDADEFNKIMNNLKASGVGQDGMNYVLQKLQGPMETAKIVSAAKGRPDLAAQVYSASLMTIDADTDAERNYLSKLAASMGLSSQVVQNIEQLTGQDSKEYMC